MFEWKNYKKKKKKNLINITAQDENVTVKFKVFDRDTGDETETEELLDLDALVQLWEDLDNLIHDISEAKTKKGN